MDSFDFSWDEVVDYALVALKVTVACSPLIAIGLMLALAREDDETEKEKLEHAKNSRNCKS